MRAAAKTSLLLVTIGIQTGLAAPMLLHYNYVRYYNEPANPATYACSIDNAGPCDGASLAPGTNWAVNYHSESSASYGVLHSMASFFLTGDNSLGPLNGGAVSFPSLVSVGARSGFVDGFTINGGSGTGIVTLSFAVTGTSTATAGATARPSFQYLPVLPSGALDFSSQVNYSVIGGVANIPLTFTFGERLDFSILFYSVAQIPSAAGWVNGAAATADYSNTAILNSIAVRDAFGVPVTAFSITAASGTTYTSNGVVPEPGTFLLGLCGITLALFWRKGLGRQRP